MALIVSTCTALFTTVGSAYSWKGNGDESLDPSSYTHYDFTDGTGICNWTKSGKFTGSSGTLLDGVAKDSFQVVGEPGNESNKVGYLTNRRYNTVTMEIGGGSGEDGALVLDSNTKYKVSFRYKWAKGSGRVSYDKANDKFVTYNYFQFFKGAQVLSDSTKVGKLALKSSNNYYVDETNGTSVVSENVVNGVVVGNKNVKYDPNNDYGDAFDAHDTYERYVLNEDSEWLEFSYEFTTEANEQRNKLFIGIPAGNQSVTGGDTAGIMTDENQFVGLYVDDIVVERASVEGEEIASYTYDFKNADGTPYTMKQYTGSDSGDHNWFSWSDNRGSNINADGLTLKAGVNGPGSANWSSWIHKVYLKDLEFAIGGSSDGWLLIEAGNMYEFTVRYRVDSGSTTVGMAMADGVGGMLPTTLVKSFTAQNDGEFHEYTVTLDGDSSLGTTTSKPVAGKAIALFNNAGTVTYESVIMRVVKKTAIPTEQQRSVYAGFEDGTVQGNIFLPNSSLSTDLHYSVVNDPLDDNHGKVLKLNITRKNGTTITFGMPAATGYGSLKGIGLGDEGYKVEVGHKYRISYDLYIENNGNSGIDNNLPNSRVAAKIGIGIDGNKSGPFYGGITAVTGGSGSSAQIIEAYNAGKWVTYARDIEFYEKDGKIYAGSRVSTDKEVDLEAMPYLIFAMPIPSLATDYQNYYFDNIQITDLGASHSIRKELAADDAENVTGEYQSAGLRFRGTISDADLIGATEVGFAVIRTSDIASTGRETWWYSRQNLDDLCKGVKFGYAYSAEQNIELVYNDAVGYKDYQLILTGLTRDGVTDKNLKDTEFSVYMWIRYADDAKYGTGAREYVYRDLGSASYASVLAEYEAAGIDTTGY